MFDTDCENEDVAAEAVTGKKGICGCGDFDALGEMTKKADLSRNKCRMAIKVIAAVYVIYFGWNICRNFVDVVRGTRDLGEAAVGIAALILVTCALLCLILKIVLPLIQMRKSEYTEEYLKRIQVEDNRALLHALGQLRCRTVMDVYMDDNGDICVQGLKCEHTAAVTDGALTLTSKKNSFGAALERETISACLLKFVAPDAPVNVYENEQNNIKLQRMYILPVIVAAVSGILMIVFALTQNSSGKYINMVQNGHPKGYPDVSYGEVFDRLFDECNWKYFRNTDGERVVEFQGQIFFDDRTSEMTVQFVISEKRDEFEVCALSLDGKAQPKFTLGIAMDTVFELYEEIEGGSSGLYDGDLKEEENLDDIGTRRRAGRGTM